MTKKHQLTGVPEIAAALSEQSEELRFLLVSKGELSDSETALVEQAKAAGINIRFESENDLKRMGQGAKTHRVLALVGREPGASLPQVMADKGLIWLLSGATYPANVGVTARTIEVAGGSALVIDGAFTREMKHKAMRIAMRPERFMPVYWERSVACIEAAREAGRRVLAVEHGGAKQPWQMDLTQPTLLVAGSESNGISPEVLDYCDEIITLPSSGFIPAYNLQIAVAMVTAEHLRQQASCQG